VKQLAFVLGLSALILGASDATAEQPPQQIPTRPYESLHTPPEAVTSAAGGPAVVLTDKVKSTVVIQTIRGGPCGGGTPYDSGMSNFVRSESRDSQPASESGSGGIGLWLPIGSGVAAVAGISLIGFWLLRRSRV
jgi:hypothetical protein